ncbi:LOW QUALITY PROTEIN: cadherin-16 [Pterocles gutturalis]
MLTRKTNASIKSICHVEHHRVLDKLLRHQNQFAIFKPGISFVPGCGTGSDDPSTPNEELQYKILTQTPSQPSECTFPMDSRTWAISLSVEAVILLICSVLHTSQVSNYHLIVQVKDLKQSLGYCALATVEIVIVENTLFELYQYEIQVLAGNRGRLLYSDPLMVLITVMDENDNLPVFTREFYQVALKENAAKRSEIITVQAENINDPKTNNSKIAYKILSQEPQLSNGFSFHINKEM